jgi:hypothetical protein
MILRKVARKVAKVCVLRFRQSSTIYGKSYRFRQKLPISAKVQVSRSVSRFTAKVQRFTRKVLRLTTIADGLTLNKAASLRQSSTFLAQLSAEDSAISSTAILKE